MLNFELFLLETLHPVIDPKTNKPFRSDNKVEQIKRFVNNSGMSIDDLWLTYSDLPKLGTRPRVRTNKTTPQGVFGYPMRYFLKQNGNMPYASDRPFILIFKVKGKVLEVGHDIKKTNRLKKNPRVSSHINHLKSLKKPAWEMADFYSEIIRGLNENLFFLKLDENFQEALRERVRRSRSNYPSSYEEALQDLENTFFDINKWANNSDDTMERLEYELGYMNFYNAHTEDYEKQFAHHDTKKNQFKLNPNYIRFLIEKDKPLIKPTMYNVYVNKIFKIQDLELIVPAAYNAYKNIINKTTDKNSKYISFVLNYLKNKVFTPVYLKYGPQKNKNPRPRLPLENELLQICQEYKISLEDAYVKMAENFGSSKGLHTPSQILYQITKFIAQLSAEKNPPMAHNSDDYDLTTATNKAPMSNWYQQRWNQILRKLGFSGVIDSKGTGQIHSSEPTQGAFVDPSKIEIVNIIYNKSGQYQNPKDMSWTRTSQKHTYGYEPTGSTRKLKGTPLQNKIHGLTQKLHKHNNNFLNALNLSLSNVINQDRDDYYFNDAYKKAVNLINQITIYKMALSDEIKKHQSEYEEVLKTNGGDSHHAMMSIKKEVNPNANFEIKSPFKTLNEIKTSVFGKLNAFFKNVEYNGDEPWVKLFKDLAKELDNPSIIMQKKRVIAEKTPFVVNKKDEKVKDKFELIERPISEKPADADLEQDYKDFSNAQYALRVEIRKISDELYYGRKASTANYNKLAVDTLNKIIKIKVHYKDELENDRHLHKNNINDDNKINYWAQIRSMWINSQGNFDNLLENHKKPNAAWYQLTNKLIEAMRHDRDLDDIKPVEYDKSNLPEEEFIYSTHNKEAPTDQGKTFEFYDDKPKSTNDELKSNKNFKNDKEELTLQKSPFDNDEEELPPLDFEFDDDDDFEPLDLSLDNDEDEDEDDNPFKTNKSEKSKFDLPDL